MTRTIARLGVGILLLTFAFGCLINAPEPPPEFFSMVRIVPDQNLEAAPEGQVYELWTFDLELRETTFVETSFADDGSIEDIFEFEVEIPTPANFQSVVRFLWDPDNYQTLDENGNPTGLYSPSGNGLDIGRDLTLASGMLLSIEPISDPNPEAINGPSILAYVSPTVFGGAAVDPLKENKSATMRVSDFIQAQPGGATFSLLAQTVQHQRSLAGEDVCWRGPNQGMGVWFAETQVRDLITEDTAGYNVFDPDNRDTVVLDSMGEEVLVRYRGTLFTRDVDRNLDGIPYQVWIFPKQPELSWSNFDLNAPLFRFTTPDLVFRDGVAIHPHPLDNGPPDTGMNAQSSHPMLRGTDTIGFMYFNPDNPTDTCFLRIDHPESTYCQSESEALKFSEFSDTNLIIRQYTTTWGDTTITPSLRSLPLSQAGALIMEAWVVFDSASNPVHPPLSLGLFLSPFGRFTNDFNPLYYDPATADPNFTFPGEDFIDMSARTDLPDSLDLLNFDGAERIKIWITIEPFPVDWAPDEPFTQLLTYVGEVLPDDPAALADAEEICDDRTENSTAPSALNYPLQYRPISVSKDDLAEGHNWPSMQIFIANPFEE